MLLLLMLMLLLLVAEVEAGNVSEKREKKVFKLQRFKNQNNHNVCIICKQK